MENRTLKVLAVVAVVLVFIVIVLGAYTRLSHAGLGCPDWPGCYGKVTWPKHEHEVLKANEAFPERPVEWDKAWKEMVHRYAAGILMLITFTMGAIAYKQRKNPQTPKKVLWFAAGLIIFQAILGMWTVTWKLKPIVVMAHLMGGFTTMCLLAWAMFKLYDWRGPQKINLNYVYSTIVVVVMQIALGGWLSANYAAMSCGTDYPKCLGEWTPETDFTEGFILWRGIGVDYEGGVLDAPARTAIHLTHRWFAVVAVTFLFILSWKLSRVRELMTLSWLLAGATTIQVLLGIMNIVLALPLAIATMHNAVGAFILFLLVAVWAKNTDEKY